MHSIRSFEQRASAFATQVSSLEQRSVGQSHAVKQSSFVHSPQVQVDRSFDASNASRQLRQPSSTPSGGRVHHAFVAVSKQPRSGSGGTAAGGREPACTPEGYADRYCCAVEETEPEAPGAAIEGFTSRTSQSCQGYRGTEVLPTPEVRET